MRKMLVALTVVSSLMSAAPPALSHGGENVWHPVTFVGAVPCAVHCAYWDGPSALGYKPCENPFPEGSYLDVLTEPAPTAPAGQRILLEFRIYPQVDWDSYICALLPGNNHNGGILAAGTNILGDNCDNLLGNENPVPVGCEEKAQAPATAGTRYVLRVYNWSDAAPCPGKYRWVFV